jgi:PAS domain S-box-containing protein
VTRGADGTWAGAAREDELRRELAEARVATAHEHEPWFAFFQLAPVAFLLTDRRGIVREANRAAVSVFGRPPSALVGEPLAAFLHGQPVPDLPAGDGEQVRRARLAIRRPELPPLRVEATVRLLDPLATHPEELLLAWAFLDVEERQAAEERLHDLAAELETRVEERTADLAREQALLETIVAQMPAGVLVATPEGRIVRSNEQMIRFFGVDAVGADALAAYAGWRIAGPDGETYAPERSPLARAMNGETVAERVTVERPGAAPLVLGVRAAPIRDAAGRVVYGVAVVDDATERERLERAERDFVTNAAHELQTPVAAIVSAAEVLEGGAKQDPDDRDRFLAHIRRECDRLARLVQALLTLARAETGSEPPPRETIELRSLLDAVALSLTPAAGVELRVDCADELTAFCNRALLEQAVVGLGSNAVKYAPEGTIWLRARETPEGGVEIEVADEGRGVSPGEEQRLFERFYRGGERDAPGFGLGLAIVRQAVAALDGEVALRRREGGGTSARVVLPPAPP